jgi:uncharacterized protein YhaN
MLSEVNKLEKQWDELSDTIDELNDRLALVNKQWNNLSETKRIAEVKLDLIENKLYELHVK